MEEERKPKRITEGKMEQRRRKGRQRVNYEDNIKQITRRREKRMGDMKRMAKERDEWREWISEDQTP